jgi:co-chaperonin GroES (HSP10)
MNTIVAIRKNIIFQFAEDVTSTRFVNSTASGIIISQQDGTQAAVPRWGKVTHVGPEVLDVNVGDFVLIEAGKWTTGFYVDKIRFWKTDEDCVMAISDEPTTTY